MRVSMSQRIGDGIRNTSDLLIYFCRIMLRRLISFRESQRAG